MDVQRRDLFLALAGLSLAACGGSMQGSAASANGPAPASVSPPASKKKILILGGTGFAGPPIVETARSRGHTVTMFNRGKTNPGLFPDVETILGDRMTQLDLLKGRDWDAVIDTWAPGPTLVTRAAELLRERVGHYVFLSTISVYVLGKDPIDERSPVLTLPPGVTVKDIHKVDATTYGPVKALAEQAAETVMPGRATSVRAGVLAGPNDPTDRFTFWPLRMARGGELIAPGASDDRLPFIDVRDLGAWFVTIVEQGHMGIFNAVGPEDPSIGSVLAAIKATTGPEARLTWIDDAWLAKNDAAGWDAFPLAVGKNDDEAGFGHVSAARAIAKGLRFRDPGETARDALAWWRAQPEARRAEKHQGLTAEREAELLQRWHASASAKG
jgi:2'-hydroxyisoflavone reductase